MANTLLRLLMRFNRLWYMAMADHGRIGNFLGEWREVLAALEKRTPAAAEKALVEHMTATPPPGQTGYHPRPYWPEKIVTGRFGTTVPFLVLEEGRRHVRRIVTELSLNDFDAIVFPGGFSPDFVRRHRPTLELATAAHRAGKVVAAICHGPWVLISIDRKCRTDIVRDRRVTSYPAAEDDMRNAGGKFISNQPAVVDGNVVTTRCPDDLPEFCQAVADTILARKGAH